MRSGFHTASVRTAVHNDYCSCVEEQSESNECLARVCETLAKFKNYMKYQSELILISLIIRPFFWKLGGKKCDTGFIFEIYWIHLTGQTLTSCLALTSWKSTCGLTQCFFMFVETVRSPHRIPSAPSEWEVHHLWQAKPYYGLCVLLKLLFIIVSVCLFQQVWQKALQMTTDQEKNRTKMISLIINT